MQHFLTSTEQTIHIERTSKYGQDAFMDHIQTENRSFQTTFKEKGNILHIKRKHFWKLPSLFTLHVQYFASPLRFHEVSHASNLAAFKKSHCTSDLFEELYKDPKDAAKNIDFDWEISINYSFVAKTLKIHIFQIKKRRVNQSEHVTCLAQNVQDAAFICGLPAKCSICRCSMR